MYSSYISHRGLLGIFKHIYCRLMTEEDTLLSRAFPVLRLLLKYFEGNPVNPDRDMRMSDIEEDLETSPGDKI